MTIIFDLDGVLVDSEMIYYRITRILFNQLKIDVSIEEHNSFVGISANKMWKYIKERYFLAQSVDELIDLEINLKYILLRKTNLKPIEGVQNLLSYLKEKQIKIAIATSNHRDNVNIILNKLQIIEYFDLIITGDQVSNGKPEPDIFMLAAKKLAANPTNCIVIEDSTNGVIAAKKAGMKCIGFVNPNSGKQNLTESDVLIDNFAFPSIINVLNSLAIKKESYASMEL